MSEQRNNLEFPPGNCFKTESEIESLRAENAVLKATAAEARREALGEAAAVCERYKGADGYYIQNEILALRDKGKA